MTDTLIRHMVAAITTIICGFAYYAGWVSAGYGWWWTIFALFIVYGGVYKIVNK